jgi:hypothetical protein
MIDYKKLKLSFFYRGIPCALFLVLARIPDDLYFNIPIWQVAIISIFISIICYFFDEKL